MIPVCTCLGAEFQLAILLAQVEVLLSKAVDFFFLKKGLPDRYKDFRAASRQLYNGNKPLLNRREV